MQAGKIGLTHVLVTVADFFHGHGGKRHGILHPVQKGAGDVQGVAFFFLGLPFKTRIFISAPPLPSANLFHAQKRLLAPGEQSCESPIKIKAVRQLRKFQYFTVFLRKHIL